MAEKESQEHPDFMGDPKMGSQATFPSTSRSDLDHQQNFRLESRLVKDAFDGTGSEGGNGHDFRFIRNK